MLLDARHPIDEESTRADVCIVGGGAAGITLARTLARAGTSVLLVESGADGPDERTQALYDGETEGNYLRVGNREYLSQSRLRFFGGSTNHWGGWCRPLDPLDFAPRDWVPGSGWPFGRAQLEPFYRRAYEVCGVPSVDYDPKALARLEHRPVPLGDTVATEIFHQAWRGQPPRFGPEFRAELARSPTVTAVFNANVTHIALDDAGSAVTHLRLRTLAGRELRARAGRFVLAAGGLENARLLLASDDVQKNGVGNEHDLVGRYFMEHPHFPVGRVALWKTAEHWRLYTHTYADRSTGVRLQGAYRLTDEAQRHHRVLNGSFTVVPLDRRFAQDPYAFEMFHFARSLYLYPLRNPAELFAPLREGEYARYRRETELFESVAGAGAEMDGQLAGGPGRNAAIFPGILLARREQAPNPQSRVVLDGERDALGMRRLRLQWNVSALDTESLLRTAQVFGAALGKTGLGRLQVFGDDLAQWPVTGGGCHHMGTTRLGDDPRTSVVDAACRVHGIRNLFVAGSSVFPTGGYANPTLTVVAMALRLADHLQRSPAA